ncbi:MAG TPA: hypothetical protein VM509_10365, partial [Planctomycetota bacterium]|nr:hypothetical protein [Planctomycetota bacterium]
MVFPLAPRILALPWIVACLTNFAPAQSIQELTGFNRLAARLGLERRPTGAGMLFAQVEAPANGTYAPDVTNPEFLRKTITRKSGASHPSSHATAVAQYGFGSLSS